MTKELDEIEKEIREYIEIHRPKYKTCVLATSNNNIPRATPVMYHFEGLNIWISTEKKEEGKTANILTNPQVSLSIFDPVESEFGWDDTRGLQMWGKAHIITCAENEVEFNHGWKITHTEKALKAFGQDLPVDAVKNNLIYIKVIPERIVFVDAKKMRGYKIIWSRD